MFALWFALQHLKPTHVIESGIWLGQSTWLIEQSVPNAELYCIDPVQHQIRYKSKRAKYYTKDFSRIRWELPNTTLCFFDDHQNAKKRIVLCQNLGLRWAIFDDNYAPGHGDCYSVKKILSPKHPIDIKRFGASDQDEILVRPMLKIYYEFPPMCAPQFQNESDSYTYICLCEMADTT